MKKLITLSLLLSSIITYSQTNKDTINHTIDSLITTNGSGKIAGTILNAVLHFIVTGLIVNDAPSPGPINYYGTNASRVKGYYTLGTAAFVDKPVSGNASNSQVVMGNDSRLTATNGISLDSIQTYNSGSTLTINNGVNVVYIDPTGTISTLNITLPTTSHNSNLIEFDFGGTIPSGNTVITSLSFTPSAGTTIISATTPGTVVSGDQPIIFRKRGTLWYRKQ